MKKFKKIMAVLVAAMMIMATMVPAWADTGATSGRLGTSTGTGVITIANVKANETYNAYRLFELASFDDANSATQQHAQYSEAYSYVINDKASNGSDPNPWYTFLTQQPSSASPYAISTTEQNQTKKNNALFVIEPATVSINGVDTYHVIKANPNSTVSPAYSTTNETSDTDNNTARDTAGGVFGPDYVSGTNATIQAFAQAAAAYAVDQSIEADYTVTPTADGSTTIPKSTNSANDVVTLGYYLVSTTMGTLAALDTTNRNVTVYEKNDEPAITKHVLQKNIALADAVPANWVKNTDADINDTVYFRTQIVAEQGALNYKLHDIMETGLTYGSIQGITLSRTVSSVTTVYDIPNIATAASIDALDTDFTNWTVSTPSGEGADGCDFEIAFEKSFYGQNTTSDAWGAIDIKDGDIITVVYSATLNGNAVIYGNTETAGTKATVKPNAGGDAISGNPYKDSNTDSRNTNTTILTYGNKSFTSWEEATVTTYQFDIVKTKEKENSNTNGDSTNYFNLLKDAKFSLYKAVTTQPAGTQTTNPGNENYVQTYSLTDGTTYYLTSSALKFDTSNKYRYMGDNAATGSAVLQSSETAAMRVYGIEAGTYILVENEAPLGYNKLAYPIAITITSGGDDPKTTAVANEGKITVASKSNDNVYAIDSTARNPKATISSKDVSGNTVYYYDTSENGGLQIINYTSTELPSTGGMGTTVLYIVGGMLVILAGAYLFFSRKRAA